MEVNNTSQQLGTMVMLPESVWLGITENLNKCLNLLQKKSEEEAERVGKLYANAEIVTEEEKDGSKKYFIYNSCSFYKCCMYSYNI